LVQHKLSWLRSQDTNTESFRSLLREVSQMLAYEATRDLPTELQAITTPITTFDAPVISGKKLCLVSILRAGNGMVWTACLTVVPLAHGWGHIGLYRDPATLQAVEYYFKSARSTWQSATVIVVDPMLATGNSAVAAVDPSSNNAAAPSPSSCCVCWPRLKACGQAMAEAPSRTCPSYTAAHSTASLNDHGYIVPGLGDAGDRIFGTQ
jgi:uracil phosphoribosyltransferase